MFTVTTERPEDGAAIEALLDRAFGPARDAKISYGYRRGVAPFADLRLVVRGAEGLVGTVRCWPVAVGPDGTQAVLLGPLAVEPELKGRGLGAALMWRILEMAAAAGHRVVLLVGDLDYYGRFGFVPAAPHGFVMPGEQPERLLVQALGGSELAGGVIAPAPALRQQSAA